MHSVLFCIITLPVSISRGARGRYGFSGHRTTPWETPMNLMFSYSRVVAGRGLWHSPIDDPVRRTSEKLVGPYLPRPLTSPSCGAPRHPAPVLTGVGCERVSGTRMETLVDDFGDIPNDYHGKQNETENRGVKW